MPVGLHHCKYYQSNWNKLIANIIPVEDIIFKVTKCWYRISEKQIIIVGFIYFFSSMLYGPEVANIFPPGVMIHIISEIKRVSIIVWHKLSSHDSLIFSYRHAIHLDPGEYDVAVGTKCIELVHAPVMIVWKMLQYFVLQCFLQVDAEKVCSFQVPVLGRLQVCTHIQSHAWHVKIYKFRRL